MRLLTATAALLSLAANGTAFIINTSSGINQQSQRYQHHHHHNTNPLFATGPELETATTLTTAPCDIPQGIEQPISLLSQPKSGKLMRSLIVTNANGERIPLSDAMGPKDSTSIVIFLRHMGCPYCWTYANDWCNVQQKIAAYDGINGPVFVSIGDAEKLRNFLEVNPSVPSDAMFVDDYSFGAYEAVGFKSFTEMDKDVVKGVTLGAPNMSFRQWMKYFGNVMRVSPVPDGMKFGEIPEGTLKLGGTFVVKGDEVIYQWSDRLPGDHPDIQEVLDVAVSGNVQP